MGLMHRLMVPRAQPLRFAIVGGLTALTYFSLTLLLAGVAGFPIVVAMPCAYVPALALHFALQRVFVFRTHDGFALAMHNQARRYVAIGATQVVLSAIITSFAPDLIGVDERIVYVIATISLAGASYLMLRFHVFHGDRRAIAADRSS
jgi:putative flippase GtrA